MNTDSPSEPQTINDLLKIVDQDTTAGNYFVANYPPFSFWKQDNVQVVQDVMASPTPDTRPLGLYFHIPFCRQRCHFCYFRVYTDKNAREISHYLEAGLEELKLYEQTTRVHGRKPRFVYFGGGTPSYLSPRQLRELTDGMKALLPWDDVEEVTFEAEPGTLNEKKLTALRELGVTRLSLGVENYDDHILEINGRAHRSKEIWRAFDFAQQLDFPQINIDLIAGMVEETEQNWERCIDQALEMDPDSITIYQMEIPYNTTIYKQMKEDGRLKAPVADWKTKRDWVKYAFGRLESAGYTVTSAYTAVKNPRETKFVYRDELWTGADLVALGVASFSHVGGVHYQNLTDFESYLAAIDKGELPLKRAMRTTEEERLIRELILQLKLGEIRPAYFRQKFRVDIIQKFSQAFEQLENNGLFQLVSDDLYILTRDALLRIDVLLHAFFLPQHQNARYT